MPYESQIECYEHQNDPYIRHEPFPEKVPEKQDIHTDYDGYQQHNEDRCDIWGVHDLIILLFKEMRSMDWGRRCSRCLRCLRDWLAN